MHYLVRGEQGTAADLARALRTQGLIIGHNEDGTPQVIQVNATTRLVQKDIQVIRQRWREDEQYRWSKEEYRTKLQELYYRAHKEAREALSSRERLMAIDECRKIQQQIGQLDGFWTKEHTDVAEGTIAALEVAVLRKALKDKASAVVDTTAEVID